MLTLYGLKTCDTCRKAVKALQAAGHDVTFHDVRATSLSEIDLLRFKDAFGEALVNRRSTTWRGLSDNERNTATVPLLQSHPSLMKRPVIEADGRLTLGWDDRVKKRYLGE